jgi:hypothetical protein
MVTSFWEIAAIASADSTGIAMFHAPEQMSCREIVPMVAPCDREEMDETNSADWFGIVGDDLARCRPPGDGTDLGAKRCGDSG